MASFFVYKVRSVCLECGESIVFDGPALSVPCRSCQSPFEVDASKWKGILGFRERCADFGLVEGQIRNSTMIAGATFSIGWGPQRPACSGCGALLDLSSAPPGTDGVVRCAACNGATTTFPAPAWLLAVEPAALQVFGASRPASPGSEQNKELVVPGAVRPVSFACPDCGANLKIGGDTPRIVECNYCKADLFLPDPLWRALHPVKKRTPWVLAFR